VTLCKQFGKGIYFLPALIIRNIIRATTAITIKIPKPIPALNIPVTTLHEESRKEMSRNKQMAKGLDVFIVFNLIRIFSN
jgi:hypothetical protein